MITSWMKKASSNSPVERKPGQYTSKILKASALLDDTKLFFSYWNENLTVHENLSQIRELNIFGKASRSRVEDILAIFRQRYLTDADITAALSYLVKSNTSNEFLYPIFLFYSAKADSLLHDIVTKVLWDYVQQGRRSISVEDIKHHIYAWMKEGKMTSHWAESTVTNVAQHLLATLRDFGLLEGAMKKQITPFFMPNDAFAFIAFSLYLKGLLGEALVKTPEWQLLLLPQWSVERFFMEAHQEDLLEYHAAGSVVRIEFPASSLTEYAHVITKKKDR